METTSKTERVIDFILLALLLSAAVTAASNLFTSGRVGIGDVDLDESFNLNGTFLQTPTGMEIVGSVTDTANMSRPWGLSVSGDIAYVAAYENDSIVAIDISDPTNPEVIGKVTDSTYLNQPQAIEAVNDMVYVGISGGGPDFLTAINASDPTNMEVVGYSTGRNGTTHAFWGIQDLFIAGKYAYVTDTTDQLAVIDISNSINLTFAGKLFINDYLDRAWGIAVKGDYAYICNAGNDSITVVNVSNPHKMSIVGNTGTDSRLEECRGLEVKGNFVYSAGLESDTFVVINVTDPANPAIVGDVVSSTYLNGGGWIEVRGNYAYINSRYSSRLTAIDISDPTDPQIVDSVSGLTGTQGVFDIVGRYAIVPETTTSSDTISIIDLKGMSYHAADIGSLATDTLHAGDVDIAGNLQVHSSAEIGKGGLSTTGDFVVLRHTTQGKFESKTTGTTKRMYKGYQSLTDAGHNCDDLKCCMPGYHFCTVSEFLEGGYLVWGNANQGDPNPYNDDGWVDPGADSQFFDCSGWASGSGTQNAFTCTYGTTITCSTATACDQGNQLWCCED